MGGLDSAGDVHERGLYEDGENVDVLGFTGFLLLNYVITDVEGVDFFFPARET